MPSVDIRGSPEYLFQQGYEFPLAKIGLDLLPPTIRFVGKLYLQSIASPFGKTIVSSNFSGNVEYSTLLLLPDNFKGDELEAALWFHEGGESAYITERIILGKKISYAAGEYVGNHTALQLSGLFVPVCELIDSEATDSKTLKKALRQTFGAPSKTMLPFYMGISRHYVDANDFIKRHNGENMSAFLEFLFLEDYPQSATVQALYNHFLTVLDCDRLGR